VAQLSLDLSQDIIGWNDDDYVVYDEQTNKQVMQVQVPEDTIFDPNDMNRWYNTLQEDLEREDLPEVPEELWEFEASQNPGTPRFFSLFLLSFLKSWPKRKHALEDQKREEIKRDMIEEGYLLVEVGEEEEEEAVVVEVVEVVAVLEV
jgi:uncharacterized protein YcgL (UPF0745 family)